MPGSGGHKGVQMQRVNLPVEDKRPKCPDGGGSGVSAQREQMPRVSHSGGGDGVSQQRAAVPGDQIPHINPVPGGKGVQQQRDKMPGMGIKVGGKGVQQQRVAVHDKRPGIEPRGGGNGVQQQRTDLQGDGILDGSRLRPWFRAIAERLARCIILNRSWEWALTDSVLQQTPSSPKPQVGVFLDPPYRTQRKGRRQAVDRAVPGRQRGDKRCRGSRDLRLGAGARRPVQGGVLHARGRFPDPA